MTEAEFYGGSEYIAAGSETTMSRIGRVKILEPSGSGLDHLLPDATTLRNGQYFIILNVDASLALDIQNSQGGAVYNTLAAQEAVIVILLDNSTAAGTWHTSAAFDIQ